MSGEPYPGLNPDDANDRNLAPVQALLKVWDGAQGGGRNWQPVYLYREAVTGNFAARVHDTDLQQEVADLAAELAGGSLVARSVVTGPVDTTVGAGATVWLTDWIDVRSWRSAWFWVTNTGASATAGIQIHFSPLTVPGTVYNGFALATAVVAGQSIWWASRGAGSLDWGNTVNSDPTMVGAVSCRLAAVGGANPTTCTGRVVLGRV